MAKDPRYDQIFADITQNSSDATTDRKRRRSVLRRLEQRPPGTRRVALYYTRRDRAISQYDVLPFTNMLKSIGSVENLDLIVVSNGGDGTAAETMLDLCRKYCTGSLRVVVPLYAKSAATLVALGADEIVMGETSELGPIDAQVEIIEGNAPQQVSADHFIRARDAASADLASPDAHTVQAAQIQLSLLNPAFLQFCMDSMQFGKDFARKQLRAYMLREECKQDKATWDARIDRIVENLTSSSKYLTHGRMITALDISQDPDLQHLKVKGLNNDDPYWIDLNELLVRTEIVSHANEFGKILFARNFQMVGA